MGYHIFNISTIYILSFAVPEEDSLYYICLHTTRVASLLSIQIWTLFWAVAIYTFLKLSKSNEDFEPPVVIIYSPPNAPFWTQF